MTPVKGHRYLFRRGHQLYFRRAVPLSVRASFNGRAEVLASLRTSDVAEARHLLPIKLAEFEQLVSAARGDRPPAERAFRRSLEPSLSEMEQVVRMWLADRLARPGRDYSDPGAAVDGQAQINDLSCQEMQVAASMKLGAGGPPLTTKWIAEHLTEQAGWQIEIGTPVYRQLIRLVSRGQIEAAQQLKQDLEGLPRRVVDHTFSPDQYRLDQERGRAKAEEAPMPIFHLFDGYLAERQPAAATAKAYRRQITAFIKFIGHDDARRVSPTDVVAWKNHLLTVPNRDGRLRAAKTVGETYLAALKTVMGWGCDNQHLSANPTLRVRVRAPRQPVLREKGLTDAEALLILRATLTDPAGRLSPERAFARRWVPWICAYTGARVNEITQLRGQDVVKRDGIWTIRITPEAGSTKSHTARIVALHPDLVAQGFPDVASRMSGPLFFNPALHRGGNDGNPQSKKVGEYLARWVREIGVDDVRVQPNHGWRHRFKSQARLFDLDPEVRDVIQGHVPRNEAGDYGDTFPAVSLRELARLPPYQV